MKREPTKAELILKDAQSHIDEAQRKVDAAKRDLNEAEMMLLIRQNVYLDLQKVLAREPQKSPSKKSSSKSAGKGTKSRRASSLEGVIQRTPKTKTSDDDDGSDPSRLPQYCLAMVDDNGGEIACGKTADDNVHHLRTNPDYHEFVSGKFSASSAPPRSSANGAGGNGTQNSATQPEDVSPVAREASGGG